MSLSNHVRVTSPLRVITYTYPAGDNGKHTDKVTNTLLRQTDLFPLRPRTLLLSFLVKNQNPNTVNEVLLTQVKLIRPFPTTQDTVLTSNIVHHDLNMSSEVILSPIKVTRRKYKTF